MTVRIFSLLLMVHCFVVFALGQGYQERRQLLEIEKKRLLEEIHENEIELSATTNQKENILNSLNRIEQNIFQRKLLISSYNKERDLIVEQINKEGNEKERLDSQKQNLQKEYASILRWVHRNKINHSLLHFILSAETFNKGFQRFQLIRQYNRYRTQQAKILKNTIDEISNKIFTLKNLQKEKNQIVQSLKGQEKNLMRELAAKTNLINGLESTEKNLIEAIAKQEAQRSNLQSAIESAIKQEMEASKRNTVNRNTFETKNAFSKRKGLLDWPVRTGVVTQAFGKKPHPTLKKILIQNNGINIKTDSDAAVLAVHEGIIVGITEVPGYNYNIILKHDQGFFTVYTNLSVVSVKKGAKVHTNQILGRVPHSEPEFHFEIWHLKEHLDPLIWLNENLNSPI